MVTQKDIYYYLFTSTKDVVFRHSCTFVLCSVIRSSNIYIYNRLEIEGRWTIHGPMKNYGGDLPPFRATHASFSSCAHIQDNEETF